VARALRRPPPYNGILGLGTRLPPVEQSPNVLYSSDPFTAWDLGDLSNKSMTVMGSNKNFGNDATTWDKGVCKRGSAWSGYWGDGRDAFLKFSLSAPTDMFVSGEGSAYHTTNVALFDGALGYVDCNGGPGGGDYWGRLTRSLLPGDWYAVSDGAVDTSSSVADRLGNFQLRFHNLTADPGGYPSWQTADLPIPWTTVETELLARNVNIVSVISPGDGGTLRGLPDATELANITGSVDQFGNPYIQTIAADGSGLSTALLDAVRALIGNTRRDISFVAEDNPASGAVDETEFVKNVTSVSCPTTGINNCLGGVGTSICDGCLQGAEVAFQFRLGNTSVTSIWWASPVRPRSVAFRFESWFPRRADRTGLVFTRTATTPMSFARSPRSDPTGGRSPGSARRHRTARLSSRSIQPTRSRSWTRSSRCRFSIPLARPHSPTTSATSSSREVSRTSCPSFACAPSSTRRATA